MKLSTLVLAGTLAASFIGPSQAAGIFIGTSTVVRKLNLADLDRSNINEYKESTCEMALQEAKEQALDQCADGVSWCSILSTRILKKSSKRAIFSSEYKIKCKAEARASRTQY